MKIEKLNQLKKDLTDFRNDDIFGLGEMAEIKQIDTVIELVDGAIINLNLCPECDEPMVYRMFEVDGSKDLVEKLTCLECNN